MLATTTPAIWGFERVGAGADAGAAVAVEVADGDLGVVEVIMPPAGGVGFSIKEDEESDDDDEVDVIAFVTPELVLDTFEGEDELFEELEVVVAKELLMLVRIVEEV